MSKGCANRRSYCASRKGFRTGGALSSDGVPPRLGGCSLTKWDRLSLAAVLAASRATYGTMAGVGRREEPSESRPSAADSGALWETTQGHCAGRHTSQWTAPTHGTPISGEAQACKCTPCGATVVPQEDDFQLSLEHRWEAALPGNPNIGQAFRGEHKVATNTPMHEEPEALPSSTLPQLLPRSSGDRSLAGQDMEVQQNASAGLGSKQGARLREAPAPALQARASRRDAATGSSSRQQNRRFFVTRPAATDRTAGQRLGAAWRSPESTGL